LLAVGCQRILMLAIAILTNRFVAMSRANHFC